MKLIRRGLLGLWVGAVVLAVSPAFAQQQNKGLIGISMPTLTSQRWVQDGLAMTKDLDSLGYQSELQYANDDVNTQISQLQSMLQKGAKALVIAAIDNTKLGPVLKQAAERKVKVFAYDRLIRGTPNVDYYTTFDNLQVGVMQGNDIIKRLGLQQGKSGPFQIELFAGSSDDSNSAYFYDGAMSVLKPYIDRGQLVVGSTQTGMDKVSTLRWSGSVARARLVKILQSTYTKSHVDAILSPYDGITIELIAGLKRSGYGRTGTYPLPVITGQDAELPSVRSILNDEQSSTVFKDTRELAKVAAAMVDAVLSGKKPTINDEKTYNNGEKVVPAYLLKPILVDKSNWKGVLVDSGYYKEYQFR